MRGKYIPMYANGGGFNDWYQNNYKSVGTASAGVHGSGITNTQQPGEEAYNTGMAGISKAGPIGAIIGGVTAIGDAIAKPIRKDAERINPNTGGYSNLNQATNTAQIGSFLNPFKGLTETFGDSNATSKEKWQAGLTLGMFPNVGSKYRRQDEKMREAKKQADRLSFAQNRLSEESEPTMRFNKGGYLSTYPNGGTLIPGQNAAQHVTDNKRLQSLETQSYGDFDKTDYGNLLRSNPLYSPVKKDSIVAVENYYKGIPGPQYMKPTDFTGDRLESYISPEGNKRFAGSEIPELENGGYLEETRNKPDMTYFANGGTHSENPNGGIPLGNKGLVEEGEFKYKDFIFSNRF